MISTFNKYLLNICVLGSVPGAEDRVVNNTDLVPALMRLIFYWDRQTIQQMKLLRCDKKFEEN